MQIEKNKIRKHKAFFIILCITFLFGIGSMAKITDLLIETDEIEAVVVKSWYSHNTKHRNGWEMNIEWTDLDGNMHSDGSLSNPDQLDVGDRYTMMVDAETHSRRIISTKGNIFMFVMGVCLCSGSFILIIKCYGKK